MKNDEKNTGEIIIFKTSENNVSIDVRFEGETVWLTQAQLVDLYGSSKANVSEHIKHIFEEEELSKEATVRKFRTVQIEGSRQVRTLSSLEKAYIENLKVLHKIENKRAERKINKRICSRLTTLTGEVKTVRSEQIRLFKFVQENKNAFIRSRKWKNN